MSDVSDYLGSILRRPPVGWWDLLDILIVSILIYEALKLIRGTRAVQMAVGSMLVVALFYVSQLAPLQTLNWLIRNALVYVAFGAIVIFQSDIRRALAHLGQAPFFRYFTRAEGSDETVEEIVVAATMLAQQRVGAIIAIEREIGLRNYIESGIPLDATLTYDLLVTIFKPGSPLHDGAVIVQEGRIAAAACFLPLTVNPRLSRELGTRHRAAIGLTEESDAAALVVSEETGTISIALNGEIERGLSPDALRDRLRSLVHMREGLMRYHPFRHLGLKVLAVALATLLWLTVAGEHVVERSLRVPLEFRNIPEALEIVGNAPDSRGRPAARIVGRAQPRPAGRDGGGSGSGGRARGVAAVSHPDRRSPGAVRRRGGAGGAGDGRARSGEVGAASRTGGAGDRRRSRARLCRGAHYGDAGERRNRRAGLAREADRGGDHRARLDQGRDARRYGTASPSASSMRSVRLVQPQNAQVTVEIWPAPVERQSAGRAGALPESGRRLHGRRVTDDRPRDGQGREGTAGSAAERQRPGVRGPCRSRPRPVQSAG